MSPTTYARLDYLHRQDLLHRRDLIEQAARARALGETGPAATLPARHLRAARAYARYLWTALAAVAVGLTGN